MKRKRAATGFLGLLVLLGVLMVGSRVLVLYAARSVLDHWSSIGLPGEPPRGSGPVADMRWPPHVRWSDVRWGDGGPVQLSCRKLEIVITPLDLLRGRLQLSQVAIEGLHVSGAKAISPWSDLIIQSLKGSEQPARLDRNPKGVRFRIDPITFDSSSVRLSHLEGWAWTPHNAGWMCVAKATRDDSSGSLIIRGNGSGAAGSGDLTLDADMGADRHLRVSARRPAAGGWIWQLAGRDDGTIASTLLAQRTPLALPVHGLIDFSLSDVPPATLEGEADLRDLEFALPSTGGRERTTLGGRLCLSGGTLSLQEIDLEKAGSHLRADADIPLASHDPSPGRCVIAGSWNGSIVRFDGTVRRIEDGLALHAPFLDLRGLRTGPVDLSWIVAGTHASHVEGVIGFGSGTIAVRGGTGSPHDPLLLRGHAIPIETLDPWLPLHAFGDWSGTLDGQGTIRFSPEGWYGDGNASLSDGKVRGLQLLDEIGSLWGEKGGGSVRFERISTRWSYRLGTLLADSLRVRSRSLQIEGSLVYVHPDSIFGLFQLSPGEEGNVGSILRLLGASSALDVGISGSMKSPTIELLDPSTRARWGERIESVRRTTMKG
jgi:hypothetical protein